MTRDTFSRFNPPDRGRFGDNEYRRGDESRALESARVSITLYQHRDSGLALLLSRDGNNDHAAWIPKSLVTEPDATDAERIRGHVVLRGLFHIEQWKLTELGWQGRDDDERQGELL